MRFFRSLILATLLAAASAGAQSTGSRDFDSSSDLLDWGTWSFVSDNVTIACWVYFDALTGDHRILSKADGTSAANHDWMIGVTNSSGYKVRTRIARSAGTAVGATTITTGQWYHVTGVLDDATGEMRVYLDGTEDGSTGNSNSTDSNTNAIYVGNQPTSTTSAPDGRISDCAVWSVVLSDANIAALAALTSRPDDFTSGLEGYLSGGDLTDSSGNGRNASNSGTTLDAADPGFSAGGGDTPLRRRRTE